MSGPLLEVENLTTHFGRREVVRAVDGVSFRVDEGEILALVGESGCGKSVTALSLVDLVPPPGEVVAGAVWLRGRDGHRRDLRRLDEASLRRIRGAEVGMVSQDPGAALNPVLSVGYQLGEVLRVHAGASAASARRQVVQLLEQVGIPEPGRRARWHPHAFSGGQQQRILIAMALAAGPSLLVADEPTTALDTTVQARIAALVDDLRRRSGTAVIWITHDLALAARVADRVAVMYAGAVVEAGPVSDVFGAPAHPYTRALVQAAREIEAPRGSRLTEIAGAPPDPRGAAPPGCAFLPRCPRASGRCRTLRPSLDSTGRGGRRVACWHPVDDGSQGEEGGA